ncbi:MAG: hypothetical protein F6J98_38250 [Moorea sp. SIO4G2]|nr:hypothetical protein [Moorena sp. SIO4G2]
METPQFEKGSDYYCDCTYCLFWLWSVCCLSLGVIVKLSAYALRARYANSGQLMRYAHAT